MTSCVSAKASLSMSGKMMVEFLLSNGACLQEQMSSSRHIFIQQIPEESLACHRMQSLPFAYDTRLAFQMTSLS